MTDVSKQMYEDFQLVYNNLASNQAAGLDIYEISMYLTKAYFAYVTQLYNQYEKSEMARKALVELVKSEWLLPYAFVNSSNVKIHDNAVFFKLPDDVLYIVYESVKMGNTDSKCMRNKVLAVIPCTHDDFHQVSSNPFRLNERNALRLDVYDKGRLSEIVAKDRHVEKYYLRYVKKPLPIILEDNFGPYGHPEDKIEGLNKETVCELNTMYHADIVRSAAEMAYVDYKQSRNNV